MDSGIWATKGNWQKKHSSRVWHVLIHVHFTNNCNMRDTSHCHVEPLKSPYKSNRSNVYIFSLWENFGWFCNGPFHATHWNMQFAFNERDVTSGVHSYAILEYFSQWEMRPDLPYCHFQTVPYIQIQRRLLKSSIFVTLSGEKPVAIERTYGELRREKDGRLLVFISCSEVKR